MCVCQYKCRFLLNFITTSYIRHHTTGRVIPLDHTHVAYFRFTHVSTSGSQNEAGSPHAWGPGSRAIVVTSQKHSHDRRQLLSLHFVKRMVIGCTGSHASLHSPNRGGGREGHLIGWYELLGFYVLTSLRLWLLYQSRSGLAVNVHGGLIVLPHWNSLPITQWCNIPLTHIMLKLCQPWHVLSY